MLPLPRAKHGASAANEMKSARDLPSSLFCSSHRILFVSLTLLLCGFAIVILTRWPESDF